MFPLATGKRAFHEYNWSTRFKIISYFLIGNENKSLEFWLNLLNQEEDKPLLEVVKKIIQLEAYQEARDYLDRIWGRFPEKEGEIQYLLACCYYGQGLIQEGLTCLQKALSIEPGRGEYLELQADCLLEIEDWRGAVNSLNQAIRTNPKKVENIYRLGTIYAYHGENLEALRCFQGCCELKPHNHIYWEMKGETHLQLEQIPQAIHAFEKALRFGENDDLRARLAYCYVQVNQLKKGIRFYRQVLKHDPAHYDSLCNLAAIYQNMDKSLEALKLQELAYNQCQTDPILLNNMAYTLVHLGRSRKAAEYYQEALTLAKGNPLILYNLAVCHVQKGNWEKGMETLEELLKIAPDHTEGWILLGNIYENLSEYQVAIDCFNRALKLA
ncbi:MAG: tetratricopeptide repeat protein [Desulfitobacterium sp.]|nr:tetratricopeptide repeat protein [Desulfitobacterium sp.]